MDEKQRKIGVLSHFKGIIRVIVFIVVIFVFAFMVIRFAQHRQEVKRAEQAADPSRNTTQIARTDKDKKPGNSSGAAKSKNGSSSENTITVPRGVDDGQQDVEAGASAVVPSTGIGENIVLTAAIWGIIAYLVVRNTALRRDLRIL